VTALEAALSTFFQAGYSRDQALYAIERVYRSLDDANRSAKRNKAALTYPLLRAS
jgi:hypothetical protein